MRRAWIASVAREIQVFAGVNLDPRDPSATFAVQSLLSAIERPANRAELLILRGFLFEAMLAWVTSPRHVPTPPEAAVPAERLRGVLRAFADRTRDPKALFEEAFALVH